MARGTARGAWPWRPTTERGVDAPGMALAPPVVTGKPAPVLDASPTVVGGQVYIGAQSGMFYALNEARGAVPGPGSSAPGRM